MILAIGLLTIGVTLLCVGPRLLARWIPGERAPLASIVAWQLTSWFALGSVVLAAALLAAPSLAAASRFPDGLEACLAAMHHSLGNPADSVLLQSIAAGGLAILILRLVGCAIRLALGNHRHRARHRTLLTMVGRKDAGLGVVVVADPTAAVYCLPGRDARIVITASAMERLTGRQRAAVLAHEHAHLRGRHHVFIASASVLSRAFPHVPLFDFARQQTAQLVEMRADDLASRGHGRRSVAEALLALSVVGPSSSVLAATAVTTAERIERLLAPYPVIDPPRAALVRRLATRLLACAALVASPVLLAVVGHAVLCLI